AHTGGRGGAAQRAAWPVPGHPPGAGQWSGTAGRIRPGENVMARRGKSQARRSGGSGGVPGWVWLAAGLVLGLALSVFVLVRQGALDVDRLPRPNPAAEAPTVSE